MSLKVFKFGGALLNHSKGFEQLIEIIKESNSQADKLIMVVSAFEKTTSKLLNTATTALNSGELQAEDMLNEIIKFHIKIADNIIKNETSKSEIINFIKVQKCKLINIIKGISLTKELTARTKDLVLSFGEYLASNIVCAFLAENFNNVIMFDIAQALVTNAMFGLAVPNIEMTACRFEATLLQAIELNDIVVTQGFIGATLNGEITTMGYESSNLSATIIAGLAKADEFVIWTDTQGIRQYDPKKTDKYIPLLISNISYDIAEFLAHSGLKMIYSDMIYYLRYFEMEVKFKSGFLSSGEFTTIGRQGDIEDKKLVIICDSLVACYYSANMIDFQNNFLFNHNNIIYISPESKTFIIDNKLLPHLELTLYDINKIEQFDVISITLVNFSYKNCLEIIENLSLEEQKFIKNIFINSEKGIIRIILEKNIKVESILMEYIINVI